eukprot:353565-Chlamydomonas_euryale.AAC.4
MLSALHAFEKQPAQRQPLAASTSVEALPTFVKVPLNTLPRCSFVWPAVMCAPPSSLSSIGTSCRVAGPLWQLNPLLHPLITGIRYMGPLPVPDSDSSQLLHTCMRTNAGDACQSQRYMERTHEGNACVERSKAEEIKQRG